VKAFDSDHIVRGRKSSCCGWKYWSRTRCRRGRKDFDRLPHVRATGITAYLRNGGKLEVAADGSARIGARTGLYDRRGDEISLDEVERIVI
jgi:hypothetical protein